MNLDIVPVFFNLFFLFGPLLFIFLHINTWKCNVEATLTHWKPYLLNTIIFHCETIFVKINHFSQTSSILLLKITDTCLFIFVITSPVFTHTQKQRLYLASTQQSLFHFWQKLAQVYGPNHPTSFPLQKQAEWGFITILTLETCCT